MTEVQFLPHCDFIANYRAGKIGMSYDLSFALALAPKLATTRDKILLIIIPSASGPTTLAVLALILTYFLNDWGILIAGASGILGNLSGAAIQRILTKGFAFLSFVIVALFSPSMLFLFDMEMTSVLCPVFFVAGFVEMVLVYGLARKTFTKRVLSDERFYIELSDSGLLSILEHSSSTQGSGCSIG